MDRDQEREQIAALGWLTSLPQWKDVFIPNIAGLLSQDMLALSLHKRDTSFTDDFLRGRIAVYRFIMDGIPQRLAEFAQKEQAEAPAEDNPHVGHPYAQDNPESEN